MKLTSLFTPIEKLIEEHGSSTIQGKHIAFLKDQIAAVKEQFAIAQRRIAELEGENNNLRKKLSESRGPTAESLPMRRSKREIRAVL